MLNRFHSSRQAPTITETPSADPSLTASSGTAGRIVPSEYARAARAAGLEIIPWTLERSGPLEGGGGWYYQTVTDAIAGDGDMLVVLDVLARQVGLGGIFTDWPATVTYYANCTGLGGTHATPTD